MHAVVGVDSTLEHRPMIWTARARKTQHLNGRGLYHCGVTRDKVPVRQRKGAGVSATNPKTAGVNLAKR